MYIPKIQVLKFITISLLTTLFIFSEQIGYISSVRGKSKVVRLDQSKNAVLKMVVYEGDTIITSAGSTLEITTKKEDIIKVNENTRLTVSKNVVKNRSGNSLGLSLGTGSIACKVKKLSTESSFEIYTPTAVAGVRGTDFAVAAGIDGSAQVSVSEGMVNVGKDNADVNVAPGQKTTALLGDKAAPQASAIDANIEKWLNSQNTEVRANPEKTLDAMQAHLANVEENSKKLAEQSEITKAEAAPATKEELQKSEADALRLSSRYSATTCANNEILANAKALAGNNKKLKEKLSGIQRINASIDSYNSRVNAALASLDAKLAAGYKKIDDSYEKGSKKIDDLFKDDSKFGSDKKFEK